jgi:hypothetical protein
MHANEKLIEQFYTAFQNGDYQAMQNAYHPKASFYDPVFELLPVNAVKAMWQMLVTNATDLKVTCSNISANDFNGKCRWEAWYTFSATGRKVHNVIDTSFEFKDGRIYTHHDQFDFWRWSKMALGPMGSLLGWSSLIQNKVRRKAQGRLKKFMDQSEKVVVA